MENFMYIYALISAGIILLLTILLRLKYKKTKQEKQEAEKKINFLKEEIELMKFQRETWKERENVILLLDWLRTSNYHNQGVNGWNQYGHSSFYGVDSEYVVTDYEKRMSKLEKAS